MGGVRGQSSKRHGDLTGRTFNKDIAELTEVEVETAEYLGMATRGAGTKSVETIDYHSGLSDVNLKKEPLVTISVAADLEEVTLGRELLHEPTETTAPIYGSLIHKDFSVNQRYIVPESWADHFRRLKLLFSIDGQIVKY